MAPKSTEELWQVAWIDLSNKISVLCANVPRRIGAVLKAKVATQNTDLIYFLLNKLSLASFLNKPSLCFKCRQLRVGDILQSFTILQLNNLKLHQHTVLEAEKPQSVHDSKQKTSFRAMQWTNRKC